MRLIDLPPLWLLAFLVPTWAVPVSLPWGGAFWPGVFLLVVAAALTVAALVEFARARTTVIPHQVPNALLTGGVFRWTRNPIYLADLLVLLGLSLIWGQLVGLLLLPVLWVVLERRFILPEEARLRAAFPEAFEDYAKTTRRWI